ncbi:hypothetical protein BDC45DRAFT_220315 [Circinella umbellata]|nr:hypothetical protein BDC45DRAFT_220315 [Circinella umbellata]
MHVYINRHILIFFLSLLFVTSLHLHFCLFPFNSFFYYLFYSLFVILGSSNTSKSAFSVSDSIQKEKRKRYSTNIYIPCVCTQIFLLLISFVYRST